MLSQKSLYGRTTIDPKLITMIYGTNAPPDRTRNGVPLSDADKAITDTEKAYYAHTGQSPRRSCVCSFRSTRATRRL